MQQKRITIEKNEIACIYFLIQKQQDYQKTGKHL